MKTNLEILIDLREYFDTYVDTDAKFYPSCTFRTDRMKERRDALNWAIENIETQKGIDAGMRDYP